MISIEDREDTFKRYDKIAYSVAFIGFIFGFGIAVMQYNSSGIIYGVVLAWFIVVCVLTFRNWLYVRQLTTTAMERQSSLADFFPSLLGMFILSLLLVSNIDDLIPIDGLTPIETGAISAVIIFVLAVINVNLPLFMRRREIEKSKLKSSWHNTYEAWRKDYYAIIGYEKNEPPNWKSLLKHAYSDTDWTLEQHQNKLELKTLLIQLLETQAIYASREIAQTDTGQIQFGSNVLTVMWVMMAFIGGILQEELGSMQIFQKLYELLLKLCELLLICN